MWNFYLWFFENSIIRKIVIFGLKLEEWDAFDEFETLCVSFLDDESL